MAKLINILAASIGGGLVLGASIRLGEAIGSRAARQADEDQPARTPEQNQPAHSARTEQNKLGDLLVARLDRMEGRLSRISEPKAQPTPVEWQKILAGMGARIDLQQAEVESIRQQMTRATRGFESAGDLAGNLRDEMHRRLSQDLDQRVAAVEEKLQRSMEAAHRETVEAVATVLETRVTPRISRLENDVTGQTAAVTELQECSLKTERSIQRLLVALERVIDGPGGTRPEPGGTPEQAGESPKLAVVNNSRAPDESTTENGGVRRSAIFR